MFDTLLSYLFQFVTACWLGDFIIGVFHWIKDSYFSPFTPIIGRKIIWPSRLHHVRPRYVLQFSDLELFVESSKWAAIWMIPLTYFYGINLFTTTLYLIIGLNDVIHKYSHMMDSERPEWATLLQKYYIFQSHDEHHQHHIDPHTVNYCPITHFTNPILEKINFWRNLENIIEKITNIKARSTDYDFVEDKNYPAGVRFIEN